jgi:hypothetical protein
VARCRRNTDAKMGSGPISFQIQSNEGNLMKSLSFLVTLLLLVMANELAAHMRKTGSLPAQKLFAETTGRHHGENYKR